jgi:hypothetical protein
MELPVQSGGDRAPGKVATTWPIPLMITASLVTLLALGILTPALDGVDRGSTQVLIIAVILARIGYAWKVAEQSRAWVAYLIGLALLVPAWFIIEPILWKFA